MKNVLIKIKGVQTVDNDSDVIEFVSEGTFEKNNLGFTAKYQEGELIGEKQTMSELVLQDDGTVVLNRNGGMSSRLVIKENERNNCFYSTPQGDLVIGIYGEKVEKEINENGAKVKMVYTIDTNMRLISRNEVEITIKEV